MKKNKNFSIVLLTAFILILVLFTGNSVTAGAEEKCSIVTIQDRKAGSPETLKVNTGDCVVWMNWSHGNNIKVVFKEGRRCAGAAKSSSGFTIDRGGSFVTRFFAYGNTASLVFSQPGTFKYEVHFSPGTASSGTGRVWKSGTIIVE